MAKETKVSFSREHTSKSNPAPHVDVYRNTSDSPKTEKIGHSPMPSEKVSVRVGGSEKTSK